MILVMNKKNGVGCTTLTYNLGRLFGLPIYVKEDSFMFDSEHKDYFEDIGKITTSKREGIFDIGADYKKAYVKRFIKDNAKVAVVPLDFGYESIIDTIETVKYIQGVNEELPIILILNRLDKQDSDKDFNYKEYLKLKFEDAGIYFYEDNLVLTYLRNSYGLYSDFDIGNYFMDKFFSDKYALERDENRKYYSQKIEYFEYKQFLYFVNEVLAKVDYRNEGIYIQDKDMVEFRNNFKDKYPDYEYYYDYLLKNNYHRDNKNSKDCNYIPYSYSDITRYCDKYRDKTSIYQEQKLIKDMAFISHVIFECFASEDDIIRQRMYRYK